ncbi:MAG: acyl-[acyl-carrier-protein] thioesterase [Lachnospiraceae bacterium]|nr:acyl-[acyl-carrier-protein] thioesterase [Lachnospiraceae bacterium]
MYTFESRIRYSEADNNGRLTMASLLNYFQDVTTFHSESLGFGVKSMKELQQAWVLNAWQIVVEEMPEYCDKVTVGTMPYDFKGFFGSRNFFMKAEDGRYLAKGNSLWTLLDLQNGRPTVPSEDMLNAYALSPKLDMEYAPRKIALPTQMEDEEPIMVKKHHLDTNNHVNNGQYVNMAMDFLPEGFIVKQLRVEYKKQAFLGDVIYPSVSYESNRFVVRLGDAEGSPYAVVEFLEKE